MAREELPQRRHTLVINVHHPIMPVTVQVGFYDDWRIGEFFIAGAGKTGSYADGEARTFATIASLALQHGAPLAELEGASMKDHEGRPDGLGSVVLAALVRLQEEVQGR
jgi:hypothetical protein